MCEAHIKNNIYTLHIVTHVAAWPCKKFVLLLFLRSLSAVFRTGLHTVRNTLRIERTTDDVVTNTGKVLNTSASDEDDTMLLKIVANTRNIGGNLDPVSQTDSGDLTKCRVRLLRCGGLDGSADTAFLRRLNVGHDILLRVESFQKSRSLCFLFRGLTTLTNKLVKGWQSVSPPCK